jgi:hypothetical protein
MQIDQGVFFAAFGGGAAAGVVILGIELIRRYWERPLVKVTVGVGLSVAEDRDAKDAELVLEASNVHGQPVTLVSCGLVLSTGHRVLLPRSQVADLPMELGLQRPVVKTVSVEQLLSRLEVWGCVPEDVQYAYFTSSTGHVFRTRLGKDIIAALSRGWERGAVEPGTFAEERLRAGRPPVLPQENRTERPALPLPAIRRLMRR